MGKSAIRKGSYTLSRIQFSTCLTCELFFPSVFGPKISFLSYVSSLKKLYQQVTFIRFLIFSEIKSPMKDKYNKIIFFRFHQTKHYGISLRKEPTWSPCSRKKKDMYRISLKKKWRGPIMCICHYYCSILEKPITEQCMK